MECYLAVVPVITLNGISDNETSFQQSLEVSRIIVLVCILHPQALQWGYSIRSLYRMFGLFATDNMTEAWLGRW